MFNGAEHDEKLNTLLDEVTERLAAAGLTLRLTPPAPASDRTATVTVTAGTRGSTTYAVVLRQGRLDRPAAAALTLPDAPRVLLLAPHVPDAAAEVLRARGVDHADAAGNLHIAWDGLLVDVRGRRAPTTPPRSHAPLAPRAFTRSGVKVVHALLAWPALHARPVREIAEAGDVSLGTAHAVLQDLAAAGYVRDGEHGRALHRGGDLLDRWTEAYAVTLAPTLDLVALAAPADLDRAALERDLVADGALLGGESAAHRLDAHLHPATTTVYVETLPSATLARHRLRRDPEGTVLLRKSFWRDPGEPGTLVPSPLVYADLVSSGDPRQREHAERIRHADDRLVDLDRT